MAQFINTVFNCVSLSSIILLTSLGLAITFGLMKVINMAHGEFLMIGAYMTYVVQNIFEKFFPESMFSLYYFFALAAAFAVTFLLGAVLERFVISRLYGREVDSLLATGDKHYTPAGCQEHLRNAGSQRKGAVIPQRRYYDRGMYFFI